MFRMQTLSGTNSTIDLGTYSQTNDNNNGRIVKLKAMEYGAAVADCLEASLSRHSWATLFR